MKKGLLILYSGPSGVGKGTILTELFKREELNLVYSVSMTTRSPRAGEIDGVSYFFVSEEEFDKALANNELLEHATFVDHSYGTPSKYVDAKRNEGKNVVLEIEIQGAKQVMEKVPDCVSIFITPPSIDELEKRIRGRGTEEEETIIKRLSKAKEELAEQSLYKYVVENDTIENVTEKISEIIKKEMAK